MSPLSASEVSEETAAPSDIKNDSLQVEGKVLLVDDEPAVSEFMQDLLESWGLTVSVFNSSVDACMKFSDDPDRFDLVVLDQTMPKMTGLDVAQHLLKLRPGLPVILYTGYSDEISEAQIRQLGIRGLVNKPVDTARLYDVIRNLLADSTEL